MTFTIPNEADATWADQSEVDSIDLDIIVAAVEGDGVRFGCAPTTAEVDMDVDVAAGEITIGRDFAVVTAGAVTLAAAHGSLPRFDLVVVNNAGTKAKVDGTAAANPVFPAIPANSIVLCAVYVPALDVVINTTQIIDKRMFLPDYALYGTDPAPTGGAGDFILVEETDLSEDANAIYSMWVIRYANPAGAYAGAVAAGDFTIAVQTGNAQNFTGAIQGMGTACWHDGTATVDEGYGIVTQVNNKNTGTITLGAALRVYVAVNDGGGAITSAYGIYVDNQTVGSSAYGIYVAGATTYAVWVDTGNVRLDGQLSVFADISTIALVRVGDGSVAFDGAAGFSFGQYIEHVVGSPATTTGAGLVISFETEASAFTVTDLVGLSISTPVIGAASTATNLYGIFVNNQTGGGTASYGIYVQGATTYALWIDSGASRFDGSVEMNTLAAFADADTLVTIDSTGALHEATFGSQHALVMGRAGTIPAAVATDQADFLLVVPEDMDLEDIIVSCLTKPTADTTIQIRRSVDSGNSFVNYFGTAVITAAGTAKAFSSNPADANVNEGDVLNFSITVGGGDGTNVLVEVAASLR